MWVTLRKPSLRVPSNVTAIYKVFVILKEHVIFSSCFLLFQPITCREHFYLKDLK